VPNRATRRRKWSDCAAASWTSPSDSAHPLAARRFVELCQELGASATARRPGPALSTKLRKFQALYKASVILTSQPEVESDAEVRPYRFSQRYASAGALESVGQVEQPQIQLGLMP
jgi:hypothetical protein